MEHTAYVSLGANVGDREANLRDAIARLRKAGVVSRISSLYETEPMELREQAWFLNCVVELKTELAPTALLGRMLQIEREMGRERNLPKGPRTIDLDLLLFDNDIVTAPELTVPHPAMQDRRFVLVPLVEIAPGAVHPILRKTAFQLLETLSAGAEVRRIETKIE